MKARYFDGKSAKSHDVALHVSSSSITITPEGRAFEARWPFHDMTVIKAWQGNGPGKLGCGKTPDARLVIEDRDTWDAIAKHLHNVKPQSRIPSTWRGIAGISISCVALIVAMFLLLPRIFEAAAPAIPDKWMEGIGAHTLMAVKAPLCIGKDGVTALDDLVSAINMSPETDYKIYVINDDEISNAFALPGGTIIVYSKLIAEAQSSEEIAGVLAHETGHQVLGHAKRSLMRSAGLRIVTQFLFNSSTIADIAAQLSDLRFNRAEESEADEFAVTTLTRAGIDPQGLSAFFERQLEKEKVLESIPMASLLMTHPASQERIDHIRSLRGVREDYAPVLSDAQWNDIRSMCDETARIEDIVKK